MTELVYNYHKTILDQNCVEGNLYVIKHTNQIEDWYNKIFDYEYLVYLDNIESINKLKEILRIDIYQFEDKFIYWFWGNRIIKSTNVERSLNVGGYLKEQDKLMNSTCMPAWLERHIYEDLKAEYKPDYIEFTTNLNSNKLKNQIYLGTYFPRTYAEFFCITFNLFENKIIASKFQKKNEINILSLGCGSGGDVLGVVISLNRFFGNIKKINITAIDGNSYALESLESIINETQKFIDKEIILIKKHEVYENLSTPIIQGENQFDFIITSKMLNELISLKKQNNVYYEFVKNNVRLISDDGFMIVSDVTAQSGNGEFNPMMMNKQINKALLENYNYKSLLPLSCAYFDCQCKIDCFYQKKFIVSHKYVNQDVSKIAYRVIAQKNVVEEVLHQTNFYKLVIHNEKICDYTSSNSEYADAFKLYNDNHSVLKKEDKSTLDIITPQQIKIDNKNDEQVEFQLLDKEEDPLIIQEELDNNDEYYNGCFVIDTNVFVECPDIISKIDDNWYIVLSNKVLEELDHLKIKKNLSNSQKKKVAKALKEINRMIDLRDIEFEDAAPKLLPQDYDKNKADNLILSVALKRKEDNPILLTSDNGLQIKAKSLNIPTFKLIEYLTYYNNKNL